MIGKPQRQRRRQERQAPGQQSRRPTRLGALLSVLFSLLLSLLLLLLPLGPGFGAARAQGAAPERIDRRLRERLEASAPDAWLPIQIVLRRDDLPRAGPLRSERIRARQQGVLAAMSAGSFELKRRYENLSGLAGWARPEAVRALERHPEVERVYLDGRVGLAMIEGAALLGADSLIALGITGEGVNVAVLDTGIDTDHPYLAGDLVAEQCFCDDSPGPSGCCPAGGAVQSGAGSAEDDDGHGTAMAGIVTSNRPTREGLARDAGIVAVRVLGAGSDGNYSDLDAGLDWVLTNHVSLGIRIVNMSLSDREEYANPLASPCSGSNTEQAITDLVAAGVIVFAASGNDGYDAGISFPACVPDAISVGGVYDAYFANATWCLDVSCSQTCTNAPGLVGTFACFTNNGALLDVLAPSHSARSLGLGGTNVNVGGTSAATAYASAEAALLLSVDPDLSPQDVRTLLVDNSTPIVNPDNAASYPRTDLDLAYVELLGTLDSDADGILDDGSGSGTAGDAPCAGGATLACDDNCPVLANPTQADADGDATGDVCDVCPQDAQDDQDADGLCANADNCPAVANPLQQNADGDAAGDACDVCPQDAQNDQDADGVCGNVDNCPADANPGQQDFDQEGLGDVCDNCVYLANPGQEDADQDGRGDVCDGIVQGPALGGPATGLLAIALVVAGAGLARRRRALRIADRG